jgi:hypothetical protein
MITHDYKRHGTIDLFARLNAGTGTETDVVALFRRSPRRSAGFVGARGPGQSVRAQ